MVCWVIYFLLWVSKISQPFELVDLFKFQKYVQSLAEKLAVSISVIKKLAVVFIPVQIQKFV